MHTINAADAMKQHFLQWFSRPVTADFIVLGMSGSYETLSRRLEAMKTIKQLSRKQITAVASALALVAAVSIVPWRLVAQERPAVNPARPAATQDPRQPAALAQAAGQAVSGSAGGEATSEKGSKEQSAQEKLIVGTWRGNATTGELVMNKDGTYQQFLRMQNVGSSPQCVNEHGKWQIRDGMLTLLGESESLAMRGLPSVRAEQAGAMLHQLKIIRLDDDLLRLQGFFAAFGPPWGAAGPDPSTGPVIFFRRVDPKAAPPEFDASLPADLKQVAEAARLLPKDALKMAGWFPREADPQTGRALRWDLVARAVKARRGQIDFAELFGLTADEAKAYLDLLKLVGDYRSACTLAGDGQLAPHEMSAVKKLEAFYRDFSGLAPSLDAAIVNEAKGSGVSAITAENAEMLSLKDEFEAKTKLSLFLNELFNYLNYTVFDVPQPGGGAFGGYGAGMGDHAGGGLFGSPPAMGAAPAAVGVGPSDPAGVGPGPFRPARGDY
jgi:hypothetical protein